MNVIELFVWALEDEEESSVMMSVDHGAIEHWLISQLHNSRNQKWTSLDGGVFHEWHFGTSYSKCAVQ